MPCGDFLKEYSAPDSLPLHSVLVSGITLTGALAAGALAAGALGAIGGILMGATIKSSEPDWHSPISDDANSTNKLFNRYADFI